VSSAQDTSPLQYRVRHMSCVNLSPELRFSKHKNTIIIYSVRRQSTPCFNISFKITPQYILRINLPDHKFANLNNFPGNPCNYPKDDWDPTCPALHYRPVGAAVPGTASAPATDDRSHIRGQQNHGY
jgi:hypothetical protein